MSGSVCESSDRQITNSNSRRSVSRHQSCSRDESERRGEEEEKVGQGSRGITTLQHKHSRRTTAHTHIRRRVTLACARVSPRLLPSARLSASAPGAPHHTMHDLLFSPFLLIADDCATPCVILFPATAARECTESAALVTKRRQQPWSERQRGSS